jgi:hypothetical protein
MKRLVGEQRREDGEDGSTEPSTAHATSVQDEDEDDNDYDTPRECNY